jgi:hypothetical protein
VGEIAAMEGEGRRREMEEVVREGEGSHTVAVPSAAQREGCGLWEREERESEC